jgi:hypothetical protein
MHTKFANAVDDLRRGKTSYSRHLAGLIERSQKFYFPQAVNVLEGKPYAAVADLLRLPYALISILSETTIDNSHPVSAITVAISPEIFLGAGLSSIKAPVGETWAGLLSAIYDPRRKVWVGTDLPTLCATSEDGTQHRFLGDSEGVRCLMSHGLSMERIHQEMDHDVCVVSNLCVMLGMRNVRLINEPRDAVLSKTRQRRGKCQLWDYHVLVVDGETWSGPEGPQQQGPGFRSHLRRGHIRRLDESRRVWVRAAFVHGRLDGFVAKDYLVNGDDACLDAAKDTLQ